MTIWERIVQANRPGPSEHSVSFRTASALAVAVAALACWRQGELSPAVTAFVLVATAAGNTFSYLRRADPWGPVKPILAVCAIGGFVWFLATVTRTATPGDISTVEGPLAVLFAWVLSTHAFDVPARRDVAYSLAGSAALMAVAAAQSVDLSLALYVVAWGACGIWGLLAMWQSMAGARGFPLGTALAAGAAVLVVAIALVVVLPAPRVASSLVFPSAAAGSSPVDTPSNLTDGPGGLPAHAASPQGPIGVGGFLGFARSLDTGVRAGLGDQVVLRVHATRPNFWLGQTYDNWDGQRWTESGAPAEGPDLLHLDGGSPFTIPGAVDQAGSTTGPTDVQTFYLAQSGPNLVFHADDAERVFLQARELLLTADGTIVSTAAMGAGTIYTVVSSDSSASPQQLRTAGSGNGTGGAPPAALPPRELVRELQLPHSYPRVATLATQITAAAPTTYDKVAAIEGWMTAHVRYSTDIPPLAPGADAVTNFLFGSRLGYCEQISTATVVMLRSLGIPAREAVGYVPGSYDPITDLYDVEAKDAHAWVQVWFDGYGWQDFDPTAVVPLANPSPGSVLAASAGRALRTLPWPPIAVFLLAATLVVVERRRRRTRPATWAHRIAADIEHGGARLGIPRRTGETLSAYGTRLAGATPDDATAVVAATTLVERAVYGGVEPSADELADALASAHRFRGVRRTAGTGSAQERASASASSNDAPLARSGR